MDLIVLAQATSDGLTNACGLEPSLTCDFVYGATENETLARFADWFVARPLKVVFILVVAWFINRIIRRSIQRFVDGLMARQEIKAQQRHAEEVDDGRFAELTALAMKKAARLATQMERSKQRSQALGTVLKSLSSAVIYGLAIVISLAEFGVSLGPLIAGAGIAGVALGFGAQSLVKDFLSGIFMLVEDQYGVGDIVDIGEASGVVEEITLRTTRLRDVKGTVWFVPNGEIRRVGNMSQQWARAVLDVEVAYDTNINKATRIIKEVADSVWQDQLETATILEEPQIWGVEAFGASSIAIRLVLKVEPGEQFATAREVRQRLKVAFDRHGIEIPFPQRTVWMHEVPADASGDSVADDQEEPEFRATGAPEGTG
ncbi:MAG: mechanosensitive ion channel family protein [Acidimicrobiia bacterium]|nr:mechanosensitive ion channel family protein [Acidimicrobiia bacterium]